MTAKKFPANPTEFCTTDVGSTTTKALLFARRDGDWQCFRFEAPTTVERPHEDVTVGVLGALHGLEKVTNRTLVRDDSPAVPYLTTSSAGGGLAMVVTGLIQELTADTADRAALGAGAIVLEVIAMNDNRSPYRKIEDLKRLRPDMVLFAGGFDADNISGPVFLAELLLEANLHPKLNPQAQLPVVYAGNANAADHVREGLSERFMFQTVPNIRPEMNKENLEPARRAILDLFMQHVMSQAPGYAKLKEWVGSPIVPTPTAFGKILGLASKAAGKRILAVDVGGATTDVFSANDGKVFRTVSANLGLSYSILNVAELAGVGPIRELYHPHLTETEVWNRIGNKYVNPTRLARSHDEMLTEWATAAVAIREAVRQHLALWDGRKEPADRLDVNDIILKQRTIIPRRQPLELRDYDLVIGSGGILSHSPREAAGAVLVDALSPKPDVEIAVDSEFMFPHLGVLADVNPVLAVELFNRLGVIQLGKATDFAPGRRHMPEDYVPPPRTGAAEAEPRIPKGEVVLTRELAIPGQVFVKPGDTVRTDTLVARSSRQFLRPFFLHVAQGLEVPAADMQRYLTKQVGDEIEPEDVIAHRPRRLLPDKTFRSPVAGRIERILPAGVLLVREKPEHGKEYTSVQAARELGISPEKLGRYLQVKPGQEVERGQWLAADIRPGVFSHVPSPVRGRVNRIDERFGIVLIEPLLEETEVVAWLPGTVERVTDRGCDVRGRGTVITGIWGSGDETGGSLSLGEVEPGKVMVRDFADSSVLSQVAERRAAGLICAGVNLDSVIKPNPPFTLVVLEGFGEHRLAAELRELLAGHEGKLALVDGTTRLRVGVQRPRVILPA